MTKKKSKAQEPTPVTPAAPVEPVVKTQQWSDRHKPVWRRFPGPAGVDVPLRVALTREAFAEITAHAKESLEAEVCGILAGTLCEDDEGSFVDVHTVVRGTSTREGRGHVTFTQETWNGIHATLERDHPDKTIVGWYHSHPGFGVEFSDMDVFIQQNFFPLPSQVALVTDPLGGEVALGCAGSSGMQYLGQFWVDGREHRARRPRPRGESPSDSVALAALETRVDQLVTAVHALRTTLHRFVLLTGGALLVALALIVGYSLYRTFYSSVRPPEALSYAAVPLKIDGRPVLLGVGVFKWEIPRELLVMPEEEGTGGSVPALPQPPPAPSPDLGKNKP